jgi:hypothetical protein
MMEADTVILDPEQLAQRARELAAKGRNGFAQAYVTLDPTDPPLFATLDVEFVNTVALASLPPGEAFVVEGGVRRSRSAIRVSAVAAIVGSPNALRLTLEPIGDYSTYTLTTTAVGLVAPGDALPAAMDPLFDRLPFKFRPGCFNLACAPAGRPAPPQDLAPAIDYLARDYESFRHVLMSAMAARVRGWAPTSEADLDQVLIDLIAARGDELADAHDRILAERGIGTARKRVSLARHARLVDYHVHQGQQAVDVVVVEALPGPPTELPPLSTPQPPWVVSTGTSPGGGDAVVYASFADRPRWRRLVFPDLNRLALHDWGGAVVALPQGATSADLVMTGAAGPRVSQADALRLRDLLRGVAVEQQGAGPTLDASVDRLLIAEMLNPQTGRENGRRLERRQLLHLVDGPERAEAIEDPISGGGAWFCRVRWKAEDALAHPYCITVQCGATPKKGVSLFFGNLAELAHGTPHETVLVAEGAPPPQLSTSSLVVARAGTWSALTRPRGRALDAAGAVARLPRDASIGPLAYRPTAADGSTPARSTLVVDVEVAGSRRRWSERIDLVESKGSDEHYVVETDEGQLSMLRFGNGINGAPLPPGASVTCRYQSGQGEAGNVGADRLVVSSVAVERVWNPFDITTGLEPQARDDIMRRAPEAYRAVQKRGVPLADYAQAAEGVAGVAHAAARYAWCGSWRCVQVAIDPQGGGDLSPALVERLALALDALRLIGDDVEIRAADVVPLDIELLLCADPHYWIEDLRAELETEFADGWTSDGRRGFFHPDAWTFGQGLHASQLIGRAMSVAGVASVLRVSMRRFDPGAGGGLVTVVVEPGALPLDDRATLAMGGFEILIVANDPDRLERGRIRFDIVGGRR